MHKLSLHDTLLICALVLVLIFGGYSLYKFHFSTTSEQTISRDRSLDTFLLPTSDDHTLGSPSAPFTLIYYLDYDCPFCTDSLEVAERLRVQYPDLRVVFRNSPLSALHPEAPQKAVLVECLASQNQNFFDIAQKMFSAQSSRIADLPRTTSFLTQETVDACLKDMNAQERVLRDQLEAMNMGLYSTPSALILKGDTIILKLNFASEETLAKMLPSLLVP